MLAPIPPPDDHLLRIAEAVETLCARAVAGAPKSAVIDALHGICNGIDLAKASGSSAEAIRNVLRPARDVHAGSTFIQRLQTWPRGYPGDFETIEWIAECKPRLDEGHGAYWLEWYALNSILGQQHRNKLDWQKRLMEKAADRGGRILNIGCGGCADLANRPDFLSRCDFVLVDMDAEALALAGGRLATARSVRPIQRNVFRGLREALSFGPYDLVLCGGLFDYIPDAMIKKLVRQLSAVVAADGQLAFTNIGDGNPLRPWMEYLASWELIHRSAAEMESLVSEIDHSRFTLSLSKDQTGLTWLCLLSAASDAEARAHGEAEPREHVSQSRSRQTRSGLGDEEAHTT